MIEKLFLLPLTMNRIILSLLLIATSLGCNKVKRFEKKISGDWTIIAYTFQNVNGLFYNYPSSGTFSFGSCETEYCNYNLQLSYSVNGIDVQKNNSGTYNILDDAEHIDLLRVDPTDNISIVPGRILHINSTQLETEFTDEYGNHYMVLEKSN